MSTDTKDLDVEHFCRLLDTLPGRETLSALGEVAQVGVARLGAATSLETRIESARALVTALGRVVKPGLEKAQNDVDFILKTASVFGFRP